MDEYRKREIGFGEGDLKEPTRYPGKEEWWEDPRSRLDLSREYHKYYPEEVLERERLLKEETGAMEKSFFELLLNRSTPKRQWLWDAKRKGKNGNRRKSGRG